MIIQCDKCGAKFQLADDKVSEKGAKVRCSKCQNVFVVKKDAGTAASAEPPPPQPEEGGGDEDPFSDFNFSDDMDFGDGLEEDIDVGTSKPQPPEEEQEPPGDTDFNFDGDKVDFAEEEGPSVSFDEPPAPSPSEPPPPKAGGDMMDEAPGVFDSAGGEGFDFPEGDDFDFADEGSGEVSAPAEGPAAPASSKGEDFGNISFGDDSFSEPEAPAAPPPGDDEWGNVDPSTDEGEDEAGFGDFQFDADDSLPGGGDDDEDMSMDVDDFARTPSKPSSSADDLEADIGDSETDSSRKAPAQDSAAPPPPKPVMKAKKESSSKGWLVPVIVIVLIIGGVIGGIAYTGSQGWFGFGDLFSGNFVKACDIPALQQTCIDKGWIIEEERGEVAVTSKDVQQIERDDGTVAIVVSGEVLNNTNKRKKEIKVVARLKNKDTGEMVKAHSYCNVYFTEEEIVSNNAQWIKDRMDTTSGRDLQCIEVKPGQSRQYAIVFVDPPSGNLGLLGPEVESAVTLE